MNVKLRITANGKTETQEMTAENSLTTFISTGEIKPQYYSRYFHLKYENEEVKQQVPTDD